MTPSAVFKTCTKSLLALLVALAQPASAAVRVAGAQDVAFRRPQLSADGVVAVMERVVEGLPCSDPCQCPTFADVVVLDLRAECGNDVHRELTRDGISLDPSLTADGTTVVFRSHDPCAAPTTHCFWRADLGSGVVEALGCETAEAVDRLEVSPDGAWLTYWRKTATAEEIVLASLAPPAPPITPVVIDSGSSMLVNDQHPIDANGRVYYSKLDGGEQRLFVAGSGLPLPQSLDVPGVEELEAAVREAGAGHVFLGHDSAGVTNVYFGAGPITSNADPSARFDHLGLAHGGAFVTFASTADLDPGVGNADGSWELFRAPTGLGPTMQLTNFVQLPMPGRIQVFAGTTGDFEGDTIVHAVAECQSLDGVTCPFDTPRHEVFHEPIGVIAPQAEAAERVAMPPFDVVTTPLAATSVTYGCTVLGSLVTCTGAVRTPPGGADAGLAVIDWWFEEAAGCPELTITRQTVEFSLGASERIVFTDTLDVPCMPRLGTFRLTAVSPDHAQADAASRLEGIVIP